MSCGAHSFCATLGAASVPHFPWFLEDIDVVILSLVSLKGAVCPQRIGGKGEKFKGGDAWGPDYLRLAVVTVYLLQFVCFPGIVDCWVFWVGVVFLEPRTCISILKKKHTTLITNY